MLILIYQLLITAEVILDGIFGDSHKLLSNIALSLVILLAALIGIYFEVYAGIVMYLFIRFATFDLLFGKIFKKDWFYLGKTSTTDKIFAQADKYLLLTLRAFCYIEAVLILIFTK